MPNNDSLPLDLTNVGSTVPQVADISSVPGFVPEGRTDLEHMAQLMDASGNQFAAALARYVRDIDEDHQFAENSEDCKTCGYGDTTWPCAPWMQVMRLCVAWLVAQVGKPDSRAPLTAEGMTEACVRAEREFNRYSWLRVMLDTTDPEVEYFAVNDGSRDSSLLHATIRPCRGLPVMSDYHNAGHDLRVFTEQEGDAAIQRGTHKLCPKCFAGVLKERAK